MIFCATLMMSCKCRSLLVLGLSVLFFAVSPAHAAPSPDLQKLLHQIFVEHAFAAKTPPQFEWFDDGAAYTVLEDSPDVPDAEDIVRYTTASGKREIVVS